VSDVNVRPQQRYVFPLQSFIVALYQMTPEQRLNASAERAAERYGLDVERCRWWIEEARKCNDVWPMKQGGGNARAY
jgi:hypothetical protein